MAPNGKKKTTNTRRFRQESERNFVLLIIFSLLVVGGGLIALILGPEALLTALPCLLAGAMMIVVPWLLLTVVERWLVRRERSELEALELRNDD